MPFSTGQNDLLQLNAQQFDFNVQFEQVFFAIIPSILFIASSAWRSISLLRKPTIVHAPTFQLLKTCTITAYVGLQFGLLILVAIGSFHATSVFITAAILNLVAALFMISLSLLDHSKSPRPSVLLNGYLFLTLILDIAQARTFFLSSDDKAEFAYSSIFVTAVGLKCLIILLEAQRKSKWIGWNAREHSPEETSGIFSLGVFFWLNKIFLVGYNKVLSPGDLYPLDSTLKGSALQERFSSRVNYSRLATEKYGLVKKLLSTLKVPILLPVPARLALLAFTFCQPLFIQSLINYLSESHRAADKGFGLIGASAFIYAGVAVSTSLNWYFHHRCLTMMRAILVTEIYRKATRSQIGTSDDGAALSLMSTDIERVRVGLLFVHDIWASAIQVGLAAYLLYRQVGFIFVAPIIIVIIGIVALTIVMRYNGDSQKAWMAAIQKRVSLTATVIAGMKNLKISGLSSAVGDLVQQLRVEELAAGTRFRQFIVISAVIGFLPMMLGPPLTFAFAQHTLNPTTMFTSLSYLGLLTNPLLTIFQSIPQVGAALACLERIQAFLVSEDRQDFRQLATEIRRVPEKPTFVEVGDTVGQYPLVLKDACFGWKADSWVLNNVSAEIPRSSLTMVIGPVASGKSTFCKALLGETPFNRGAVYVETRLAQVGFCDQTPFLSNGSIKDNIIGFSEFDSDRYESVIYATALNFDLDTLARGDMTNIGSDGITLSGGQKQRVSLARALYLHTDLLVLDDIFSGLDADTEDLVFQRVFGRRGLLRQRKSTAVLCTHSTRHLPASDHILALGNGTVVQQGSFTTLMKSDGYVRQLGLNLDSGKRSEDEANAAPAARKSSSSSGSPAPEATDAAASSANASERMHGDKSVYKHYIRSVGLLSTASCLLCAAMYGFFTNFPTIWLKYWSEDNVSNDPNHSFAYYAGIYALMQILALVSLAFVAVVIFVIAVRRAGTRLHREALRTLIKAPLSFFTSTDTGVVTNLFSQDLNLIDSELSIALLNVSLTVAAALGQAAVMLTASYYMAVTYPFLIVILYFLQRFYLRTSRQLRLLDLEAKSPLYTHFLDTVKGISTLRAFGFIGEDIDKNAELIDASQRPAYLLAMTQQWLTLVLDLVVMLMAVSLTALAVELHSNAGFAGASLVTLMGFGENLATIVTMYTRLETSIGAIGRLKTFNESVIPEDKIDEIVVPAEDWPRNGTVELTGVSASYKPSEKDDSQIADLALKNLHLKIAGGEKLAICGRTGSGKSSLVALLLKLLDPTVETTENIVVDGTQLQHVDRPTLRQRILAIPQEAVFLPDGSSFQANLDPLNTSTFEDCLSVLAAVGMWQFVHDRGGLTAGMSPSTLSAGQRQLMSLGRTLLRRRARSRKLGTTHEGGLLLLDEVSSNVDHATERVMQNIIRDEFRNYTVIAVSHRLDMIMDFDRVIVMDRGSIVEVGNPVTLAQEQGSRFGDLVRASTS